MEHLCSNKPVNGATARMCPQMRVLAAVTTMLLEEAGLAAADLVKRMGIMWMAGSFIRWMARTSVGPFCRERTKFKVPILEAETRPSPDSNLLSPSSGPSQPLEL